MIQYSIVLPMFNGGSLLHTCVSSILEQDYPHWELLVLDSGSSDGSLAYIKGLNDERIRLFTTTKRLFIAENWQRMVDLQLLEFATIIGQDDVFDRNFLSEMNKMIELHPAAGVYQAHYRHIDGEGRVISNCKPLPLQETPVQYLDNILSIRANTTATGYVFRSADYKNIGGIPDYPNLLFADFELWLALTEGKYKVNHPGELLSFRIHQSVTSKSPVRVYFDGMVRFTRYVLNLGAKYPDCQKVIQNNLDIFLNFYGLECAFRIIRSGEQETGKVLTVRDVVSKCGSLYAEAGIVKPFKPAFRLRLALLIGSSFITKWFYQRWRDFRK